jgi:ATPase subunit of ABC transporter with duplicated ATPase domains
MTTLLQCYRVSHAAGTKHLFQELDLTIQSGDKIGMVGHNGCGKSTLLSILNRNQPPDDGEIAFNNSLVLETVEQFIDVRLTKLTLFDALLEKLPAAERSFGEYRVSMLLEQLGFMADEFQYRVDALSGGQQNRLMFARAIINDPNLVLFDEPTNHLDLSTILLFEDFLNNSLTAGFILISHDRQFLDSVTNRTLFLRDERLYSFNLPYSAAKEKLAAQDEAAATTRNAEEKTISTLQASAKRLALWGKVYDNKKLARKAKSMEKRIAKLEDDKTFVSKGSNLKLTLAVSGSRANRMVQIEDSWIKAPGDDDTDLFYIEDFFIRPGERVALLGINGVGKTTLIKQMIDHHAEVTRSDQIRFNPQCRIGYYDQELEMLDKSKSLVTTLSTHCTGSASDFKSALIHAGFPYADLDKDVAVLSGGERARLMFLIIKLNQPNFLILDEPTNHIDIQGKEELETQIRGGPEKSDTWISG